MKRGFNTDELLKDPDDWAELIYVRAAVGDIDESALSWLNFWGSVSGTLGVTDDPKVRHVSYGTWVEAQRKAPPKPHADMPEINSSSVEIWKNAAMCIKILDPMHEKSERVQYVTRLLEVIAASSTHVMDLSSE